MIRQFAFLLAIISAAHAGTTSKTDVKPPVDVKRLGNPHRKGPVLEKNVARPLRYRPEGTDFVIENGTEFFNRPLYGSNTAFRVDAGDKPELAFYLPGRGGNLRLGIRSGGEAKWLHDARNIITRYRSGSMLYEIRDGLLGSGVLRVTVLGLPDTEGLIVRTEIEGAENVELIAAFGGANGDKDRSSVDIGCGSRPVSDWFQLKPLYCTGNEISIKDSTFTLKAKPGSLSGFFSAGTKIVTGDAADWDKPGALATGSAESTTPLAVAVSPLSRSSPAYLVIERSPEANAATDFAALFDAAEKHRRKISESIVVDTPDPFINAAVPALCTAGEAVWDEKEGAWMHGAVAWRVPLLGWRGDYTGDALGWHDRQRRFFQRWSKRQNTKPVPEQLPEPFPKDNLSRNENALHSNGDMSGTHYDMNLVFIDALFRHLLWTGDKAFAREMWPVIERHLAWERRLFRREFGTGKLPLYEGYCCIWASDDLWYAGGAATHASAYNFYQNRMAARVAAWIGADPVPYMDEADRIAMAMRKLLWLEDKGCFAEGKDLLGLRRTHDQPALWTFYHTMDSGLPSPSEARRMMQYAGTNCVRIPIKGEGVPTDRPYFTLPTTNWMPYAWSTNNVVMAESSHASLAFWQAGMRETAFDLFKGCIMDSMAMGICPGNVGMCTGADMARGESQRDFADGVGMVSRALIEGLFGVTPDALTGEITIRPGFPSTWDHATLRHPDVELGFKRDGLIETYLIRQNFAERQWLRLEAPVLCHDIAEIMVNGKRSEWNQIGERGAVKVSVTAPPAATWEVRITWRGQTVPPSVDAAAAPVVVPPSQVIDWNQPLKTKTECIDLSRVFNDHVTRIFRNEYLSPRSPFCSLAIPRQGYGSWCHPDSVFNVDDSGLRAAAGKNGGRIALTNGLSFQTPGTGDERNIAFVSLWDNHPDDLLVPLAGKASHAWLLMAGSTNPMQSRIDNGEVIVTYTDGSTSRLALQNPSTWWPVDQDYVIDDYAFRYDGPIPPRVDLKTGKVRFPKREELVNGPIATIPGGSATVLELPLEADKTLESLTVRALSNEVVIGLMSVTLSR